MVKKKEKKKEDIEVDFGIGKLSVGGIFKGIEKLVDLAQKLEEAGGEIKKEGEIDFGNIKNGAKGVFGFSIKSAVGGKPVVESFGNIKKTDKGARVEEEREPIVDVFDEKNEIRVYAEMPGINQKDIKLDLKGDVLDISASGGSRKYHKEILLPAEAEAANLSFSYTNGILEIRIKK
ncbi:MAG: archaeal heat shock protein Hsp20 [Elusimicrobiota bacterium]